MSATKTGDAHLKLHGWKARREVARVPPPSAVGLAVDLGRSGFRGGVLLLGTRLAKVQLLATGDGDALVEVEADASIALAERLADVRPLALFGDQLNVELLV